MKHNVLMRGKNEEAKEMRKKINIERREKIKQNNLILGTKFSGIFP